MSTTRTLITTITLTAMLSATAIEAQPSVLVGGSSDLPSTTETLSLDETREIPTDVTDQRFRVEFLDSTVIYTAVDQRVEAMSVLLVFRERGLDLPHLTIEYFTDDTCPSTKSAGYLSNRNGELWITNCAGRRTLLHELSHVWDRHNLAVGDRAELLELRGLEEWGGVEWEYCGGEHLAEAMAWALDDSTLPVYRIRNNSYEELGAMYLLATGSTDAPVFERTPSLAERSQRALEERTGDTDGLTNNQILDQGDDLGAGDILG